MQRTSYRIALATVESDQSIILKKKEKEEMTSEAYMSSPSIYWYNFVLLVYTVMSVGQLGICNK